MKKTAWFVFVALLASACAVEQKKVEQQLKNPAPINCATAEGDIRVLQHEKVTVAQRVTEGVTMIAPAGIVIGILTGTERMKFEVATDQYNDILDERIAAIKQKCRL